MNLHEASFVRVFISLDKRDRYLGLFETKKSRAKLVARLDHNNDLDPRLMHKIPSGAAFASSILAMLKVRGAPSRCHVLSVNSQLDGKEMELEDALKQTIGYQFGTVISCIPGKLGYFEAEDMGERYLLW